MDALEIRRLRPEMKSSFVEFCHALESAGDTIFFHPHVFNEHELDRLTRHDGLDHYYLLLEGQSVLGYGMLRGWDEGYTIPSLGIAIHPHARSCGLGRLLMHFLHAVAQRRGSTALRLKVHQDNSMAIELYRQLGYSFESMDGYNHIGIKTLSGIDPSNAK